MIRRDDLIMEKKNFTAEDLRKQCEEAKKNYETLNEQLKQVEQEEEENRRAQLAIEKESRKKEVDEAFDKYNELLKAYIKDYGVYSITTSSDDLNWWPKLWRGFF